MTKRPYPSSGTPLNYKDHPSFEDIPEILEEQKTFFDRVFAAEGDIFKGFVFDWTLVKKLTFEEMYICMLKLRSFNILDVPDNVVSKVAKAIAPTMKIGIWVEYLNQVIGKFSARRGHFEAPRRSIIKDPT